MGYSPLDRKELDTTERLTHTHIGGPAAKPGAFFYRMKKGINKLPIIVNFRSDVYPLTLREHFLLLHDLFPFPFVRRKSVLMVFLDLWLHSLLFPLDLRIMAAGKFASLPRNMPVNHQFPLASSMDLLSSKSPLVERRADAYQDVSIHGTLPRKKKGPPPIRSCDNFSHVGTLPHSRSPRHHSPLIQDVIQEQPLQDWKGEAFTFR